MTRATGPLAEWPVTISDGLKTVGLMWPNKTGIRQLPRGAGVERKALRQQTWNGGRGAERYAPDTTRFYDALNAWTMVDGQWVPGPLLRLTKTRDQVLADAPVGDFYWSETDGRYARSFVAPASFTAHRLAVMLRVNDLSGPDATVALCSDSAGSPGGVLWSGTLDTSAQDTLGAWAIFVPSVALVSGTTYWVTVKVAGAPGGDDVHRVAVGLDAGAAGMAGNGSGGAYAASSYAPLFYLSGSDAGYKRVHYFVYQQQLYAMRERADRTASDLLINGDRGVATGAGQSTKTVQDTTKAWAINEFAGCVVYVVSGANKGEWRVIESNGSNNLELATALPAACGTGASGSVYVILGSDKWTAIVSGLAAACTSVAVCAGLVYFATGDATVIRRMREYNNAGVWTRQFADDGTNKAELLLTAPHHTDATASVYRANNDTSTVSVAKKAAWGTNLTFETGLEVGDVETRITSLTRYDNQVWAVKDDSVWSLDNGKFGEIEIGMQAARDERNGLAATGWNVNFYFAFQDGLERLYGRTVDDIGPNRDMGMPEGRRGSIAALQAVLQYLYAAHDAGAAGVSCVLASTSPGGAWHELARGREAGQRITSLFYQAIPGRTNKLWLNHGDDLAYLVMPDDTHNPISDSAMRYAPESAVVSAWFDLDSPELDHYFDEVRVMSRNLAERRRLRLQYKVDVDDDELADATSPRTAGQAWTTFDEDVATSPLAVRPVGDGRVTGSRIKIRAIMTSDTHAVQVINWLELRANQMNEVLYQYVFDLTIDDRMMLMSGNDSTEKAAEVLAVLHGWQEDATPLTMRVAPPSGGAIMDAVTGHLDPVGLVVQEWDDVRARLSGSITFMQT